MTQTIMILPFVYTETFTGNVLMRSMKFNRMQVHNIKNRTEYKQQNSYKELLLLYSI